MVSVRIQNVTKKFGKTVALDNVSVDIPAGELFFLLGPSGCGKSTLLRAIAGLHAPTSGSIFFGDRDVTRLSTEKRNAVMCFQSYALWPHMSVRQNVQFGLDVRKTPKAEAQHMVDEALGMVQLTELADRKPNQLSGGQQQRVALARALVVKPDCLLLDEPLSNLDAKLRLEMRAEIRRICRQANLTAIYVTHDQKEALSIADRLAILSDGRIEQVGSPTDVYLRPANKFVANFIGETNFIAGSVTESSNERTVVQTGLGTIVSTVAPAEPLSSGQNVTLSIRPEVAHLRDAGGSGENTFAATVHDSIYLGEVAQHQVNLANMNGQPPLKVFELNPRFLARDEAQQQASLYVDPRDVIILTR